jgi:hypothetical protein
MCSNGNILESVDGKDKWGQGQYQDLAKRIEQCSISTLPQVSVVLSR